MDFVPDCPNIQTIGPCRQTQIQISRPLGQIEFSPVTLGLYILEILRERKHLYLLLHFVISSSNSNRPGVAWAFQTRAKPGAALQTLLLFIP